MSYCEKTIKPKAENSASLGILFIVGGMLAISINDMLIKELSGDYPLHELVFFRSAIGLIFSVFFVRMMEAGVF